jgi:DNA-binding NarL/FixJ family response regulator
MMNDETLPGLDGRLKRGLKRDTDGQEDQTSDQPVDHHADQLAPQRAPRVARVTRVARAVIVDDHELARAGLRSMLSGTSWLDVVGEATDGRHAQVVCRHLRPDLVLMDVRMPGANGIATTRAIKDEHPTTSVVIVTMYDNPEYLLEALKAGAAGYVLKDSTRAELLTTLKRVLNGDSILDGELAGRLLRRLASETPRETAQAAERLTLREREVLRLLAQGLTNREIAAALIVSVGTVKVHVEHIIAKLGVSDRTQAAVRAVALGLLDAKLA